jgi:hypothetical protein
MKEISEKGWRKLQTAFSNIFRSKKRAAGKRDAKRKITELYQRGNFQEAASLAVQSAESHAENWFFHHIAGKSFKELGRESEACRHLNKAFIIRPDCHETFSHLIGTIAVSRDVVELAETYSHSLSQGCISLADSVALHRFLSAVAASQGLERAADIYRQYYIDAGYSPKVVVGSIRSVRSWAALTRVPLLEAGEIEEIPFKPPVVYGSPAPTGVLYGQSNKPYVAEIADVRVFSHSSVILASDGTMLSDDAAHERFGEYVSFEYERRLALRQGSQLILDLTRYKEKEIEAGIFLAGLGSEHFGHWFPEFLPRIEFFRQHPDFGKLPIIVDSDMPKSHFQYLRRLVDNELILLGADESLRCRRLLVASSPTFLPVHLTLESLKPHDVPGMSPRALQFLQKALSPKNVVKPHRRIFLARANMQWRRLINESEVVAALVKLGFEVVRIEDMSAADQIDLFHQAEWIVAPNGSALLNIIFADTSAKVLALSQPSLFNWGAFQGPMEVLGYRPVFVCGEYAADENKKHSDYSIPPGSVEKALQDMGLV